MRLAPVGGGQVAQPNSDSGNDALFCPQWTMSESNIYTGEVSAILDSGTVDVHVTEY